MKHMEPSVIRTDKELPFNVMCVFAEQYLHGFFLTSVRFFPLRWCGPTTSK